MDPTPLTGQQTLHPNSVVNNVPTITYSKPREEYINFRRARLIAARDMRDQPCQEHDDMPFLKWYDTMKKADDQYVAPRKNPQDTSINIGTIRDKDSTLVEFAQRFDFEPIAQVYDEDDDMIEEMAETAEDMVKKSYQLEEMKDKSKLIARSMVAFGTAMVEDSWVERWTLDKKMKSKDATGSKNAEWVEKLVKCYDGCQSKLWDLRKCYFGDIKKFFLNGPQGQPYFFTAEYVTYDMAKSMFESWDNWKYVPTSVVLTTEASSAKIYSTGWTLRPVTQNAVEIIRYYDPVANEFALTLNGIDMLPIMEEKTTQDGVEKTLISGFPLTEISPSGAIPFGKFDLEPMHDFAYSKPQPAKMRVLGDIQNMLFKIMLRMFKQKADPTMGNKSGRSFGPEVSDPGTTINDIRDGDLFPILPNYRGPESSDFSMFELVAKELSRNSVEDSFQGIDKSDSSKKTATEDMNTMKAQSLSIAAMFDGLTSGYCQLFWLRTYNIIQNWTKPIDKQIDVLKQTVKNVYRTVSMPIEVDGGKKAQKKIIFTTDTPVRPKGKPTMEDSMDVHQDEMDQSKATGTEIRKVYLNPEVLRSIRMNWFYKCIPVPNDSDPLSYMVFAKQINDAITFFGPQSLNVKKLKRRFAVKTGNDFDTWFLSEAELQQQAQQQMQADMAMGGKKPGATPGGDKPTVGKTAQGQAPVPNLGPAMQ